MGFSSEKRGNKGQVTLFVMLGFVLLISFVVILVFAGYVMNAGLENQAKKAVDDYLTSSSIGYYVYTCMDAATTNAMDQVALQGGVFYDYQDGPYSSAQEGVTHIPYNLTYTSAEGTPRTLKFNVSYSIQNKSDCEMVNETIPDYPYSRTKLVDLEQTYSDGTQNACLFNSNTGYVYSGFFGLNNITTLCYVGSNNSRNIADVSLGPCFRNTLRPKNSTIEHLLETQIKKQVEKCINFSYYETEEGHNITILQEPTTTIVYNKESLSVNMEYPFIVKLKGKEPVLVKHDFEYKSDLRLTKIHNYLLNLLKKESSDPFFNLAKDYYTVLPQFDSEHMKVSVVNFTTCSNCGYKYDQILIVEDNASKIGNRSLTFLTAIKNRRPALDFIHETAASEFFDILVTENETINLNPFGIDPDDKQVKYKYIGWKETWDDECALNSAGELVCTQLPGMLYNWTNSTEFKLTNRSANYTTNASDIGYHNTTIVVEDESGLIDFQTLNILVFDLPTANLTIPLLYPGMPNNTLTIEDPVNISGQGSIPSAMGGGTITGYLWKATYDINSITYLAFENKTIEAYRKIPLQSYNIKTIKPLNLSHDVIHEISLAVEQFMTVLGTTVTSTPTIQEVNVTECAPHRNSTDPYSFPYNKGSDPFYANHTCCLGDIADSSTYSVASIASAVTCFQGTAYGEFTILTTTTTNDYRESGLLTGYPASSNINAPPTPYPGGDKNDIYKMLFNRICDGQRGNICAGEMQRTIIKDVSCANNGVNELCVGPPPDYSNSSINTCYNYPAGQTFETTFSTVGTGICNQAFACSTINSNGYGAVGGPQLCKAICDGTGNCDNTANTLAACTCSVVSCNAQCDETKPFTWTIGSKTCQNNCDYSNTCAYSTFELPCAKNAVTNTAYCLYSGNNPIYDDGTCYYQVTCDASNSNYQEGQYCKVGEHIEEETKYCLWGTISPSCNTAGECNLNKSPFPCAHGQIADCNLNTGWSMCTSSRS
ncbi:hypothetical protein COV13_04035 [Candidatus Woesearchaeota archaeon CG10_big_fil_rev_8_21_14_0_10_32_9]|nr:MAG: hypothetical protein COV13_04035 [Candidatus Woesearchaeota archaeon CG10_big_fil_rev_8_21_14_0_10_32_9]